MGKENESLFRIIARHGREEDLDLIRRAYAFAEEAHRGKKRLTGEPYVIHPLATAKKLALMNMSTSVIVAALLHDVLEDTFENEEDVRRRLRKEFGADVADLVERVTKLGKVQYRGIDRYVENLRKMFIAMAEDVRAIFIKFADRIHNLETLQIVPEEKARRIAREALDIYAPIANRLSMGQMRGQLEDLGFRYVIPHEYAWVSALVEDRLEQKKRYTDQIKKIVARDLDKAGISIVDLSARTKHLYSLYKKLLTHNRNIGLVHDLVALRVQVPNIADCYAALGIIHSRWKPLKGRIKDYIAQPKPNGYQSLHTTVFCEDGEIVEIQIRTPEMHRAAEYGIAAHWQYTEAGKRAKPKQSKDLAWIQELATVQRNIADTKKFLQNLEEMKIDVFQNRIFVFTPRGDVFDLPEGATPVDFAYAIHSDIGNRCTSAKVNDEMVSLDTPLRSWDMVEIVTDKHRKAPNTDWLKFVKTNNAKDKIRSFARAGVSDWVKKVTERNGAKKR